MKKSLEPGKTGDEKTDRLLSSARQEPLQVSIAEIEDKIKNVQVDLSNRQPEFRLVNRKRKYFGLFSGLIFISLLTFLLIHFLIFDKSKVVEQSAAKTKIKNESPSVETHKQNETVASDENKLYQPELHSEKFESKPGNNNTSKKSFTTEGTATVDFMYDNKPVKAELNSMKVFSLKIDGKEIPEEDFSNHTEIINEAYKESEIKQREVKANVTDQETLTRKLAEVIEDAYPVLKDSAYTVIITAKFSKVNDEVVTPSVQQLLMNTYQKLTGHSFAVNGKVRIAH